MLKNAYNEMLAEEIGRIYDATEKITFSKNTAAVIVGGRRRLEDLVDRGKIRKTELSNHQHGKWQCVASDVLRHAYSDNYETFKHQISC